MDKFEPPFFPTPVEHDIEPSLFYAEMVYDRIVENVNEALANTPEGEQIIVSVPLADGGRIIVESFGFHNPSFIIVVGTDTATGHNVEALVSHTNIQILISRTKVQPAQPPRRISLIGGK